MTPGTVAGTPAGRVPGAQRHDAAYAEAMDDELDIACAVLSAGVTSDDLASAR